MRGYQKKVVHLKNTGSNLFDEAYFVMKDGAYEGKGSTPCLVMEANRIIEESFGRKKSGGRRWILYLLISFLSGGLITALLAFISGVL